MVLPLTLLPVKAILVITCVINCRQSLEKVCLMFDV